MSRKVKDRELIKAFALPNGAATTVSAGIDLQNSTIGEFEAGIEVEIEAPSLSTAQLPDTKTMIYDLYHDTASGFGSEVLLASAVVTQTGASGAGAAAATNKVRLPSNVKRYIRAKATNSGTGNASAASANLQLLF